ncbi:metalloregulator ArsR/SmtB family transcription factor [Bradyrhizobium sp. CCH5-F6]|uniref:ArsR/SmtB family transcription factor n=1 Tax=Bradyrhizobium sp. CCH5-F6 TaxID=1768753 RepID=UPI00076A87A1|nr:metalloregulator ArsR/SmtB family transcription factor [Bradyrhizobium sp. CCH5-F6]
MTLVFNSQGIENAARDIANLLRAVANERRLLILCRLVELGEATVNSLADSVGLSQSALSQHLARMRDEGLVTYRRESQKSWYRIADPRIEKLLATLHELYCRPIKPR